MNKSITEKQFNCIKKFYKQINDEDLKKLSLKEASKFIKTHIVNNIPLLQWYAYEYNGNIYSNTTMGNSPNNEDNVNLIVNRVFLNKRLLDEYLQVKTIRKSEYIVKKYLSF